MNQDDIILDSEKEEPGVYPMGKPKDNPDLSLAAFGGIGESPKPSLPSFEFPLLSQADINPNHCLYCHRCHHGFMNDIFVPHARCPNCGVGMEDISLDGLRTRMKARAR